MVGGTLLTKRDTFLNRSQTMQLIYAACTATQVLYTQPSLPAVVLLCAAAEPALQRLVAAWPRAWPCQARCTCALLSIHFCQSLVPLLAISCPSSVLCPTIAVV